MLCHYSDCVSLRVAVLRCRRCMFYCSTRTNPTLFPSQSQSTPKVPKPPRPTSRLEAALDSFGAQLGVAPWEVFPNQRVAIGILPVRNRNCEDSPSMELTSRFILSFFGIRNSRLSHIRIPYVRTVSKGCFGTVDR